MSHDQQHAGGGTDGAGRPLGFLVRSFPEDPDCVGVRITDREYLLTRQDAIELALLLLDSAGVNLLSGLAPPNSSR
ncbi:hypothetical protein [Azospirillum sp.]|uniref:hypothetical protein n=1 Tax=Azospirillum sp. TaxID=34012 RepID=UPI002D6701A8|nr:hypothetical protein [Azospirillum sp.]HYD67808.1 hypothetical protein [Azospirillum sp.]